MKIEKIVFSKKVLTLLVIASFSTQVPFMATAVSAQDIPSDNSVAPSETSASANAEVYTPTLSAELAATPAKEAAPSPASETAPSPANETAPSPASEVAPSPANETAPSPASEIFQPQPQQPANDPVVPGAGGSNPANLVIKNPGVGQSGNVSTGSTGAANSISGGGGSSGGQVMMPSGVGGTPEVLGAFTENLATCNYMSTYVNRSKQNDTFEVMKLQMFLRSAEGFTDLKTTGVYDDATFRALSAFQEKYKNDILTPWGLENSTGHLYILTKKKINEIVCQKEFPLTASQKEEIRTYAAVQKTVASR